MFCIVTCEGASVDVTDELSDLESAGLEGGPLGLDGDDPGQGLLRVDPALDDHPEAGTHLGDPDHVVLTLDRRRNVRLLKKKTI